ncbi:hypothetical protein [Agromyces sp. Soil535]|uniref:hypothetical protein n=1 Tax=Agromyces sp. Soil535 TaxID=1736390 RepID=UPI001F1EABA7|nr:hypothetical protein [Agromyces sp. Soil535]
MPDPSTTSTVRAASKVFASPLTENGTETLSPSVGLSITIADPAAPVSLADGGEPSVEDGDGAWYSPPPP